MPTSSVPIHESDTSLKRIRLSEVISSLSYALDITEGQPEGHAVRSCAIGLRLAKEIGLSEQRQAALFYALLLKDLGCSSNAAKMCWLFNADDRSVKRDIKLVEWTSTLKSALFSLGQVSPGTSLPRRLIKVLGMGLNRTDTPRSLIQTRCERGADITRLLGFPEATARAILDLDEHWNGGGHPVGLRGDQISLEGRICSLAQTMEVFMREHDVRTACQIAKRRSGSWFDPELVRAFKNISKSSDFISTIQNNVTHEILNSLEPLDHVQTVDDSMLDKIALAFSRVIDAKSPWTLRHSEGVSDIAVGISETMNFESAAVADIRRAGLLHDIGKLGVSNLILDKPGKLTDEEFRQMKSHCLHTQRILERVTSFHRFADYASAHHERIDGKGYHRGLSGDNVPPEARILAVADVCEALTAHRPYRDGMPPEKVISIITGDAGTAFCPVVVDAFMAYQERVDLFAQLDQRAAEPTSNRN